MEYLEVLEELERLIRRARAVPLSASVVVPREQALALVQRLRELLPQETERAREVLAERDGVLEEARAAAQRLLEEARAERARLVARTEVVQAAKAEAKRIVEEAQADAARLRVQADDYVDAKLANFEILLNKTLKTVHRGREQLRRRLEAAQEEVAPLTLEDSGEISGELPAQEPAP